MCGEMTTLQESDDVCITTLKRLAEKIQAQRETVERNRTAMETAGDNLLEATAELDASDEATTKTSIDGINQDIEKYNGNYNTMMETQRKTLNQADTLLSSDKKGTAEQKNTLVNDFGRFTAVSDLKPNFLDNDASMIEIHSWIEQFESYITLGYKGNPPSKGIYMHMRPLMHVSWMQALQTKSGENLGTKTLEELMESIKIEGKLRMPVHQRRLA